MPSETRTYELLKVKPEANKPLVTNLFRFEEMQGKVQAAGDGTHQIPYEDLDAAGASEVHPYRRLIEHAANCTARTSWTVSCPWDTSSQWRCQERITSSPSRPACS